MKASKNFVVVATLILAMIATTSISAEELKEVVLDNGMTVLVKEIHNIDVVAVNIWVNTGSINETDENNGISHFIEHMMFKGTEKRGRGDFDLEIESVGGQSNAGTSMDFTYYYVTVASRYFDVVLDVLSDSIMNSVFDPNEVEMERKVILEEINRRDDNPSSYLVSKIYSDFFSGHPYARPILGPREIVENMSRDTLIDYYQTYYVPNNMTLVIIGDVDSDEVIAEVKEAFADFEAKPLPPTPKFEAVWPKEVKEDIEERDVNQVYLAVAFPAPPAESDDSYIMDVLIYILGEGRSSRLYQQVKENKQLVLSIRAGYLTQKEPGMLRVHALFDVGKLDEVKEAILEELEKLKTEPVTDEELGKVKTMIESEYAFNSETNSDQAFSLGYWSLIADLDYERNYLKNIRSVTKEDVIRVAQKYLTTDVYTLAALEPKGE